MKIEDAKYGIIVRTDFDREEESWNHLCLFKEEPTVADYNAFVLELKNDSEFNWVWPDIETGIFKIEIISGKELDEIISVMR